MNLETLIYVFSHSNKEKTHRLRIYLGANQTYKLRI
jgi:hypothetical protein